MAQSDIFLQLAGVDGESKDAAKAGQIQIDTMKLGGVNSGANIADAGKSKVSLRNVEFEKKVDKSTPTLFQHLCQARTPLTATITVRKSGGKPVDYMKIELSGCYVSQFDIVVSADSLANETFSLSYREIKFTYYTQDESGSLGPANMKSYSLPKGA